MNEMPLDVIAAYERLVLELLGNPPALVRRLNLEPRVPIGDYNLVAQESALIESALEATKGSQRDAARLLGISARSLSYRLKRARAARPYVAFCA